MTRPTFKSADPKIDATVAFVNNTSSDIRILKWETPFDSEGGRVNGDYLNVFRGSERVTYIGPILKRAAPRPEDYITLKPGARMSATVNLEDGYALLSSGVYNVSFKAESLDVKLSAQPDSSQQTRSAGAVERAAAPRIASSSVASFVLSDGRESKLRLAAPAQPSKFEACSPDQQSALNEALPKAQDIAAAARQILGATSETERAVASRYANWFGSYTADRYGKIAAHFSAIDDALRSPQFSFACGGNRCSPATYAYVFPTQPYRVYPCDAFWRAGVTGTDSKAGTLVHETSHFNVVAGTLDLIYGQAGAMDLARRSPDNAIQNADSHEYFAENTPELSMKADAMAKQEAASTSK